MADGAAGSPRLNLGCGGRTHPDWVNVDIAPRVPGVVHADLSRGIPYPDERFDAVYHSHLLEHIRRADALPFMQECCRVLKRGGILRVATPDLERLCEVYLARLRAADGAEDDAAAADHEWMTIEMLDQTVRERTGGSMLDYLRQRPLPNEPFVLDRIGEEGRELLHALRSSSQPVPQPATPHRQFRPWPRGLRARARRALVRSWYGDDVMRVMEIGRFRLSGEVHHWLYDRVSLARLMVAAGFRNPVVRRATESAIPGWSGFCLDTRPDGHVAKPDSFFMEAERPDPSRV